MDTPGVPAAWCNFTAVFERSACRQASRRVRVMGSSAGRRSAAYRRAARTFQSGWFPCWLASGPWCTGRGTSPDHDPPLHTASSPERWRGVFRPACLPCQHRQGGAARAAAFRGDAGTDWTW